MGPRPVVPSTMMSIPALRAKATISTAAPLPVSSTGFALSSRRSSSPTAASSWRCAAFSSSC